MKKIIIIGILIIVIAVLAKYSKKQVVPSESSNAWNSVQEKADTKIESKDGWVRLWYQIKDFFGESHFIYNLPSKLADNGLVIRARGEGAWMVSLGTTDVIPDLSMVPYFMIEAKKEAADLYLPFSDFGFRGDHTGDVSMPKPEEVKSLIFTPSLGWSEPGQSHFLEIKEIRTYKKGTPTKTDKDGDGIPNHDDYDIDGDGWFNVLEGYAGTDQMDPSDFPNGKLITPSSGCYTGLLVTSGATGILEFETLTGMKPAIINLFPGWEIDQDARLKMDRPFLEWIWRHGSIPRHSWLPEGKVRLQDIIDGKHDQMIAELAEEVKALRQPIIWPWGVEVDGSPLEPSNGLSNFGRDGTKKWYEVDNLNSYYGSPDEPDGIERWKDYVSYVRKIFDRHGVNNVVYFFHALGAEYTESGEDVMDGQFPVPGDWNTVTNYYPGARLVDWVGFSLIGPSWNGIKWTTIDDILDESYLTKLRGVAAGKPIMIPEFAFFPQTNWQTPPRQSRAELFSKVFNEIKTKYPSIKAWMFENTRSLSPPVMPMWAVAPYMSPDSPPDEVEAFREAVTQDPYFIKNPILSGIPAKPGKLQAIAVSTSQRNIEAEPDMTSGVMESGFCSSPPTIDGRIGPGEWKEARIVSMEMDYYDLGQNLVETHPAKIYLMNNRKELFVGLTLEQEEHDGTWSEEPGEASLDLFMILFDGNDDGIFGVGEDKKFLSLIGGMSLYSDQHQLSEAEERQGKEEGDERQHGAGSINHSNPKGVGDYTAEFKIPLSSGDSYDIDLKPGAKARWNIAVFDKFGSELEKMSLGALSEPDIENSSGWGYLALADGHSGQKVSSAEVPPVVPATWSFEQEKTDDEKKHVYIGQFVFGGQQDVEDFIEKTASTPPIVFFGVDWVNDTDLLADPKNPAPVSPIHKDVIDFLNRLSDMGSIPAIVWSIPVPMWDVDPDRVHLVPNIPRILNGEFDDYIRTVARQLKEYGRPIMVTFLGEFNNHGQLSFGAKGFEMPEFEDVKDLVGKYGDPKWPDGPERVRDVFIHVIDIFRQEGANNISWFMYGGTDWLVKNMTDDEGHTEWWSHPKYYYPGDEYIDWVGKSVHFRTFAEFTNRFEAAYDAWGEVTQKPFFIPEFNFAEKAKSRGKLMQRIFLDYLPTKPRFKAATFMHSPALLQAGIDWGFPLGGKKGEFPDEIQTWKEVVVKNPYYRSRVIMEQSQ